MFTICLSLCGYFAALGLSVLIVNWNMCGQMLATSHAPSGQCHSPGKTMGVGIMLFNHLSPVVTIVADVAADIAFFIICRHSLLFSHDLNIYVRQFNPTVYMARLVCSAQFLVWAIWH